MHRLGSFALLASLALFASPVRAGESAAEGSAGEAKPNLLFNELKTLVGSWSGTAKHDQSDKPLPSKATIKLVSGGSALMLTTDPGTSHEMVTMFHADDDSIVATHYCAAQNQPRMRLQPQSTKGVMVFEFFDGTNLGAHPGRMQRLELELGKPARHTQRWTYSDAGKLSTMEMTLARAGGAPRTGK